MKKNIKKSLAISLTLITICVILSGCFNYRDINRVVFITAMVIDVDSENNIVLYTEAFKPARLSGNTSEKGQRILFKGKGKTLFEAVRDATLASSFKNNYTQNRAIIITEKAAEKGLDLYLDFLDRDQEFMLRSYLFIYAGDVEKLVKLNLKQEEYIGAYLYSVIQITGSASRAVSITLNQYLTKRLVGSKTEVLPMLQIRKESLEDTIEINGGAVIQKNKYVSKLEREESQGYNFLIDNVGKGTLEVTNPQNKDAFVTLEILNSNTKTDISISNGKIKLNKNINVNVSVAEVQKSIELNKENKELIEKYAEANIKKYCTAVFESYKKKDIDIFKIKEVLDRKYPHNDFDNIIKNTDLTITTNVEVEGSSNKTNNK